MTIMEKFAIGCGALCAGIVCIFVLLIVALCIVIDVRDLEFGKITTDSMSPTMEPGNWRVLDREATPKIGDIVVFHCSHEDTPCFNLYGTDRIGHRIVSISPDGCMRIIGDNPKYADLWRQLPCFPPEDIVIEGVSHKLWF